MFFFALMFFLKWSVFAANITITWDASPSDDVVGYAVYYGYRNGEYPTRIDARSQLSIPFQTESGSNYFFVVTAYGSDGIESHPSGEATYFSDPSLPHVAVTSPSSNFTFVTTNSFVTLTGIASDDFGIVQIIWSNRCSGLTGAALGTTNWSADSILLCNGTNSIAVTARDVEGNVDKVFITIVRNDPCGASSAAGTFSGLFTNTLSPDRSGFFTLKKGNLSRFTGTINLAGWRRGFSGRFTNGIATVSIARGDTSPLILQLQTESCEQDHLTGILIDRNQEATLFANRVVFNGRTNPAPYTGKYTVAIFGGAEGAELPQGIGFATARVLRSGAVRVQGVLGDGKSFAQSTHLSKTGFWPFYASPYRKIGGSISGWLNFSSQMQSDLQGDLIWTKPTITNDAFYSVGFSNSVAAIGSIYNAPTNYSNRVLDFSDGTVTLAAGELVQGFAKDIILATNRIIPAPKGVDNLSFNINNSVGSFTGTIQLPGYSARIRFRGGLLQKMNAGYGLYLGTNQIGQVALEAAP
jgi:hypothetical protein